MIKLSVIIVLYNEYELVIKTISSIYENIIDNMEIILIDNSPNNEGQNAIFKKFPKIKYFHSKKNLGFGGGVNEGVRKTRGEFVLILTPDMYLLPGAIRELLSYIQSHKDVGLVGGRVYSSPRAQEYSIVSRNYGFLSQLYYYNMPFYKLVHRFNKHFNPLYASMKEHRRIQVSKIISGQSMLIRKNSFEEIGGFDLLFFMYFEDIDLCKRITEAGWKVVYLPVGGVVQNGISRWKRNVKITQAHPLYMKSLYLFFEKHYGKLYMFLAWAVGTLSVLMSIPYLFLVYSIKSVFNKESQSRELLPLWIRIAKWHFTDGLKLVFK